MCWLFKKRKHTIEDIDLGKKCSLKFDKNDYGNYIVSFYHPLYKCWWTLPEISAGIYKKWSLLNHGSFGAYDIHKYTCHFHDIDCVRNQFKTLEDINNYLEMVAKNYDRFKEHQDKLNKLPQTII